MLVFHPDPLRPASMPRWACILLLVPESGIIATLLVINGIAPSQWIAVGLALVSTIVLIRLVVLFFAVLSYRWMWLNAANILSTMVYLLAPWSPDTLTLRGMVAFERMQMDDAVVFLRRSVMRACNHASVAGILSLALLARGTVDEATHVARWILGHAPTDRDGYSWPARIGHMVGVPSSIIEGLLQEGVSRATTPDDKLRLRCALAHHFAREGRMSEAEHALNLANLVSSQCRSDHGDALQHTLTAIHALRSSHHRSSLPEEKDIGSDNERIPV